MTRGHRNNGWFHKTPQMNRSAFAVGRPDGLTTRRELEATIKKLTEQNRRMRERITQLENRK